MHKFYSLVVSRRGRLVTIATCNGGNITISSDAIPESSEWITENIVGANH
jgi:hypothetical protein